MLYAFVPAAMAVSSSSFLLFASPLTIKHVIMSFTSLMLTQLVTWQVDIKCVEKEMAPKWFLNFRKVTFTVYMILSATLFAIFYTNVNLIQRRNDPNRITTIKSAMELEDADFIKMVDELKIDYDELDLKEVEKEVKSKLLRNKRDGKGPIGL